MTVYPKNPPTHPTPEEGPPMNNLMHYMLRPSMPLPNDMVEAIGGSGAARDWTWTTLTNAERDALWALYPMNVAIATFGAGDLELTAVAESETGARRAVERAWLATAAERPGCGTEFVQPVLDGASITDRLDAQLEHVSGCARCEASVGIPAGDNVDVLTGPVGSVWRDGSFYPKGDNN
jgi:hypothetical protein